MPEAGSKFKGREGEQYAEAYLQGQGLFLVERNYRCRFGEIDLIMREGEVVVFIEVRMRSNQTFGGAAGSITLSKQGRLMRTAGHYLASLRSVPACRFDVVLLSGPRGEGMEWIKNAFCESA
jgi:putative endonuclease